jgi:small-conductance mechanosensitive channel
VKGNPDDELAKARLALDQNELEDVQGDIARQDREAKLNRLLQEHQSLETAAATNQPKPAQAPRLDALWNQLQAWRLLQDRKEQVLKAQRAAAAHAVKLDKDHAALDRKEAPSGDDEDLAQIAKLSNRHRTLAEYDKRIQDSQRIEKLYGNWVDLVDRRLAAVQHALLVSLTWILAIALGILLGRLAIRRAFAKLSDRRRRQQLQTVSILGVQLTGLLLVLLVGFGPPNQISTIIGFATAGVTLVMKDFIMAFFGWFVLIGRNGIHVGDWVEINGVGGEVIEVDMLRTVLLEVGNWTDRGHPTGRKVTFMNSFVFSGQYFNFSTSDQWLWDELTVSIPSGRDPYQTAQRILETVQRETEADAQQAERDWQRMTHKYGTRAFSAKPAVDIRPASTGLGLDVHVRYITRAPSRYEVKSRLFEEIVEVLQQGAFVEPRQGHVARFGGHDHV